MPGKRRWRAAWQEARALFEAALAVAETAEALEGLGAAAWWLGDGAAVFTTRERAYRLYRDRRDDHGAARWRLAWRWITAPFAAKSSSPADGSGAPNACYTAKPVASGVGF